jgi:dihydrofolate reductase
MGKVFFSVGMSLDGFIAPEGMDMAHADDPSYKDWLNQWMELQKWVFQQRFFRENLQLGEGGETGQDNRFLEETFNRTGVSIMGKRMFEGGERFWPEEAPFHTPVFVLTKEVRSPWERPGGTTFHFVNDGIESALRQAHEVAGDRDIRIAGGANAILQYLNAGLVDEFDIALAPVFFSEGIRLFERIDHQKVAFEIVEAINSPLVTHLRYTVTKHQDAAKGTTAPVE